MPTVSIILPLYNGKRFLKETIDSVLCQSFKDFEFIIVDDGSTDHSEEIYSLYKDKLKVIKQENSGCPAKAKNRGIKESSGDFLAFIDQDDLWENDKLEKQIGILKTNSKIGLVLSNAIVFDSNTKENLGILWSHVGKCDRQYINKMLLNDNFIMTTSQAMVRKEVFCDELFDEKMSLADDYELWYRISKKWDINVMADTLTKWRYHRKSLSNNNFKMFNDLIYFYTKASLDNDLPVDEKKVITDKQFFFLIKLANLLTKKGNIQASIATYKKAQKINNTRQLRIVIWLLKRIPFIAIFLLSAISKIRFKPYFPELNLSIGEKHE